MPRTVGAQPARAAGADQAGLAREDSYRLVAEERHARRNGEGDLLDLLKADPKSPRRCPRPSWKPCSTWLSPQSRRHDFQARVWVKSMAPASLSQEQLRWTIYKTSLSRNVRKLFFAYNCACHSFAEMDQNERRGPRMTADGQGQLSALKEIEKQKYGQFELIKRADIVAKREQKLGIPHHLKKPKVVRKRLASSSGSAQKR